MNVEETKNKEQIREYRNIMDLKYRRIEFEDLIRALDQKEEEIIKERDLIQDLIRALDLVIVKAKNEYYEKYPGGDQ